MIHGTNPAAQTFFRNLKALHSWTPASHVVTAPPAGTKRASPAMAARGSVEVVAPGMVAAA